MAVPLNTSIPNTARVCGWQIARKARRGKQHRAPFSCGTKEASASQRGKQNKSLQIGVHGGFAGRDTQTQALHSSVQPAYSFSTYRDEGSLSEVAIADYLSGKAVQGTTAEVQAVCALTLPAASDGVQIAHCIEVLQCLTRFFCVFVAAQDVCSDAEHAFPQLVEALP